MELTAAIKALEHLKKGDTAEICTDSRYLLKGITDWINSWRDNDWYRPNGKKVINKDLWLKLHKLNEKKKVKWVKVRAHSGNEGNKLADKLAREGKKPYLPANKQSKPSKK